MYLTLELHLNNYKTPLNKWFSVLFVEERFKVLSNDKPLFPK